MRRWALAPDGGQVEIAPDRPFSDPEPELAAAFTGYPRRMGPYSMAGLETIEEPGTHPEPVFVPSAGGYEAVTGPLGRSSTFGRRILPQLSVAFNHRLLGIGPARAAWPRKEQASQKASELPRGNPAHAQRPQPIFPNRVTDWPRAVLRWPAFGGGEEA